jgi:hypothetical protein
MFKNITKLSLVLGLVLVSIVAISAPVYAVCTGDNSAQGQVIQGIGQTTTSDCTGPGVDSTITTVVDILSYVVGIVALFMIVFSGFQFITSGGNSNAVSKARNALLYSIIGLLMVALAQFLVHFVLNAAVDSTVTPITPVVKTEIKSQSSPQ